MADCDLLATCLFFNDKMPDSRGMGSIYKDRYCKSDHANCARHIVAAAIGRANVPQNLYPNMLAKAQQLIAARG